MFVLNYQQGKGNHPQKKSNYMDVGTYLYNLSVINLNELVIESVKETEVLFLDANADQLMHGKRSTGELIGKYANPEYAAMKYAENPLAGFGNIDLVLTWAFKRGINIKYQADGLLFDSTGKEKEGGFDILEHFGDDVLGITDEKKEEISPEFQEVFVRKFNEKLEKP